MSKQNQPLILIVDDEEAHRLMLLTLMEEWGFKAIEAENGLKAVERVKKAPVDLILMDLRMPDMDGIEATRQISRYNPAIPIIIMTAYSSIPSAVEALKAGAYEYQTKPLDFDALRLIMGRALEHIGLQRENEGLRQQLARLQVPNLLGRSPSMQQLLDTISLVAPSEATVLIMGESGTGKGLVARAIHANSDRRDKPLVEVNCAAIPETLIESELFGHERGAFTGASRQRQGKFAQANSGTIFLDEVGELRFPVQAKLLRVLQEGDIQRVGSDVHIPVDVRVIAATNRRLDEMVAQGEFREDLYYRLNVVAVEVPPLRNRIEDIPLLSRHFWEIFSRKNHKIVNGITPRAVELLLKYYWPGNVRELENAMERAVILLRGETISEKELPGSLQQLDRPHSETPGRRSPEEPLRPGGTLADLEKQAVLQTLRETDGNKSETARRLGVTRRTLQLKLKKYSEEE